ncbi:5'-AMP-activated protein kinase beta subunit, interation domain-containing protein [Phellopilus nigrolimitatus]|nr:5'-AMP-activated protein kinase beta subunit, interation domain-containing protein [Phellopilus nigrolimitatus]
MGNTSSSANNRATATPTPPDARRSRSQHRGKPAEARSPSHTPSDAHNPTLEKQSNLQRLPHRSLRTKKKSLELPDLALALTPAPTGVSSSAAAAAAAAAAGVSGGPYRRPQASTPIAIPTRPGPAGGPGGTVKASQEPRLKTIPTAVTNVDVHPMPPMAEVIVRPAPPRGRGNPHIRGAPLQYSSTHSFTGTSRAQASPMQSFALRDHPHGGFIPEDVHSSIPLALRKAELGAEEDEEMQEEKAHYAAKRESTEEKHPAQVCIVWRGGGKSVVLMRAGDNNWKGRQPMDYDEATNQWTTWVSLMPGTHHIRFLVDNVSTVAEDLPTAVDDNGSFANYVAVPISGYTPPSATLHPTPREQVPPATSGNGYSFFADAEAGAGGNEGAEWTDKVPWQLECAAEEEEQWLSHSHTHGPGQPPPPQHPQAPSLPRHLEKLIMNQKPPNNNRSSSSSSKPGGSSATLFGGALPVTTASGTNLSASTSGQGAGEKATGTANAANLMTREMYTKLENAPSGPMAGLSLADDGSVLPVPSHVVLHHLGTSAIRNGVLAVADTTRYKKKVGSLYITTIYYKPT